MNKKKGYFIPTGMNQKNGYFIPTGMNQKNGYFIPTGMNRKQGYFIPIVMLLAVVVFAVTTAILSLAYMNMRTVKRQVNSATALNISEAGINYYLWHLSHNNTDYCDGQACVGSGPYGPYVHEYKDTSGVVVGKYTLTITPPISGGTTATVRSEGEKTATGEKRTIISTLGMPSFSEYSYVSDYEVWFGSAESTQGLVHSNRGVHYDGTAAGVVSSTASSYIPTTCFGGDGHTSQNGVWGNGGPKSYWQFPVPKVDFSLISANLQDLRTKSLETGGLHIPNSNKYGYKLVLNGNNTVTISTVKKANNDGSQNNGCISSPGYNSLINEVINPVTYNLPSNGVIFVDDNVWVSGTLNSRLTIATGQFPEKASTYTKMFLQDNIIYSAYDGSVALGLIAQSDIVINSSSANNLEIDGYLMSQYGNIFRPYYSGNIKNHIKIYGGIAPNKSWTWNWVSGNTVTSGYRTTEQVYDNNLALRPPPEFPTTGSFAILSWKEEPIL